MITNTANKVIYTGDGNTKQFLIDFPFGDISEINLFLHNISTGEDESILSNWSYDNATGYITYPVSGSAMASTHQIVVIRQTPLTQEKDHTVRLFTSEDIETISDKLTREVQDISEKVDRSIKFPASISSGETDAKKYIDDLTDLKTQATTAASTATAQASIATSQATIATTKASEAATSAQNAATSESNAASSATSASNSAAAAAASEQHTIQNEELLQEYVDQAEESANTAVTNATQAASSAASASASATAASASETSAATSAASASSSATTATTKAAEADASAQAAAQSAAVFVVDSVLSPTSRNPLENRAIYNELNTLKLVQIVEELPATGDGKSVYGVIQDEMTRDGYPIVQLFCWDVEDELWYAIGAYSIDIDPNGIVYEDSVPYATSTRVGGFKETFDAATGTWTVITEDL